MGGKLGVRSLGRLTVRLDPELLLLLKFPSPREGYALRQIPKDRIPKIKYAYGTIYIGRRLEANGHLKGILHHPSFIIFYTSY